MWARRWILVGVRSDRDFGDSPPFSLYALGKICIVSTVAHEKPPRASVLVPYTSLLRCSETRYRITDFDILDHVDRFIPFVPPDGRWLTSTVTHLTIDCPGRSIGAPYANVCSGNTRHPSMLNSHSHLLPTGRERTSSPYT